MGHRTGASAETTRQPTTPTEADPAEVSVADDRKVLAAAHRIAERDRELLKRLAR